MKQERNQRLSSATWAIAAVCCGVGAVLILAIAFFRATDRYLIVENDTTTSYWVTPLLQSHDNSELYRGDSVLMAPGDNRSISGGWDAVRCVYIDLDDYAIGDVLIDMTQRTVRVSLQDLINQVQQRPCRIGNVE